MAEFRSPIDLSAISASSKRSLATEVATRATDPRFYSAMQVLPNPDTVLRKLGRNHDVYEAIRYDAHVMGELRSIRAGMLAWEWRVQPGGDEPADIEAAELCSKIFAQRPGAGLTWSDVIWNMAEAVFYGYAVHEVTWKKDGSHVVPMSVLDRPQRRFHFDADNALRLLTRTDMMPGIELGDHKWLLTRHMVKHDNPYGVALFSACFWPYTFKHNGYRWFSKFIEKFGIPHAVGKYPAGTSDTELNRMLTNLERLIEDAVGAIPADGSIELVQPTAGQHSAHRTFLDLCNREISKALTSQTLATEIQGEGGSRAASETHAEREQAGQESDREMVATTLSQLCAWVAELNFPGAKPPRFEFYAEAESSKATAETLAKVLEVAPIKRGEYYARMQLTEPQNGDDVIEPRAQRPAAPVPAGAEFSACPDCGQVHHQFSADPVDAIVADMSEADIVDGLLEPVRDAMADADDLAEFANKLPTLFAEMDSDQLREQIQLTELLARLKGMDDA